MNYKVFYVLGILVINILGTVVIAAECSLVITSSTSSGIPAGFSGTQACPGAGALSENRQSAGTTGSSASFARTSFAVSESGMSGFSQSISSDGSEALSSGIGTIIGSDGSVNDPSLPLGSLIPTSFKFDVSYSILSSVDSHFLATGGISELRFFVSIQASFGLGMIFTNGFTTAEGGITTEGTSSGSGVTGSTRIWNDGIFFGGYSETLIPTLSASSGLVNIPLELDFDVPNGAPGTITIKFETASFASGDAQGFIDATHSLSFPAGETVWQAAAGATANIPSLNIVGGVYTGGPPPVAAVPIPASIIFLGPALAGLLFGSARRVGEP